MSKKKGKRRFYFNPEYEDILISGELYDAAEQMARKKGQPVDEFIAELVKDFLAKLGVTAAASPT